MKLKRRSVLFMSVNDLRILVRLSLHLVEKYELRSERISVADIPIVPGRPEDFGK